MRTCAATYTSSVSTNMSAYEDLPGHHLLSARNLIASTPDSSYPDTADEGYVLMQDRVTPQWDYSGIHDLRAFLSFQVMTDYCLTCSSDSSEGDYDPTRECFVAELGGAQRRHGRRGTCCDSRASCACSARTDRPGKLRTTTSTASATPRA